MKPQFIERVWDYRRGYSTGTVVAAEIRRAHYHRRIKKLASDTKELAEIDLKDLHSRDWRSRVTVYNFDSDGKLPKPATCECAYVAISGEYQTWELESLRSRALQPSVRSAARLVVAENIIPPVVEILGSALDTDPELLGQHIGNAWGDRSNSINASSAQLPGYTGSWLDFSMRYPRLTAVSHPVALKPQYPGWREECLKRGARFMQCRQLLPILDGVGEGDTDKVQCVAFEHVTVSFKFSKCKGASWAWEGLVLFPNSIKEWSDSKMKVEKYQNIGPRANVRLMQDQLKIKEEASKDADVENWLAAMRLFSDEEGRQLNPFNILVLLWQEVLDHWHIHLAQIAFVVEKLSTGGGVGMNEFELRRQQQLRAVIVQGMSVLSDIDDTLRKAFEMQQKSPLLGTNAGEGLTDTHAGESLEGLRRQFLHVRTQLERHLPTLQHHIDIVTLEQQVRLAETQLEESRKAIQQADTIKRLTILAFIYIPVQTAAGIFGMNVRELAPAPSLWVFFIVAVALLIITLSAAGWHSLVSFLRHHSRYIFGSLRAALGRILAGLGVEVGWLQRRGNVDVRGRTPEPSWYRESL